MLGITGSIFYRVPWESDKRSMARFVAQHHQLAGIVWNPQFCEHPLWLQIPGITELPRLGISLQQTVMACPIDAPDAPSAVRANAKNKKPSVSITPAPTN